MEIVDRTLGPQRSMDERWNSSFERDTLILAFADFLRVLLPTLLRRSEVRERYKSAAPEKVLADFDLGRWGELRVVAAHPELPRFALRILNKEFELASQVVFSSDLRYIEALRIVEFNGNLSTALVWSRIMTSDFPRTRSNHQCLAWSAPLRMDFQ